MRPKVLQALAEQNRAPQGCRIVVAFSGGMDSTALLDLLWQLRQEQGWQVEAFHLNHGLRGDEAQRDEDFCRDFCRERGIPLTVARENIAQLAQEAGESLESCGRRLRYEHLAELCPDEKDRIATAHNLNDLAETQLFHLIRGSGIRGLGGIPLQRGKIIRPLLLCSREEIEGYCRERGLPHVEDSSNRDLRFSRNRIRQNLLPQLVGENGAYLQGALRLSQQVWREEDYWQQQVEAALAAAALPEGGWSREKLLALHPALLRRVGLRWLALSGAEPSAKGVELCLSLLEKGGEVELSPGRYFQVRGERALLRQREVLQAFFSCPLELGLVEPFPGKKLFFRLLDGEKYKLFANNRPGALKNTLDCGKISGIVSLRQRLPGDALCLPGHQKATSLKKLLNARGLSLGARSRLVLLADDKGPLWLEGFGPRAEALPGPESREILLIQVLDDETTLKSTEEV